METIQPRENPSHIPKPNYLKPVAIISVIPIGLYAFSKYKNYPTQKTVKVTVIGSVVIVVGAWLVAVSSIRWS